MTSEGKISVAVSRAVTRAPTDFSSHAAQSARVSSRALGWAALNFERRDYQPSSRTLAQGSSEHLVFVSLTTGRIVRNSGGERVEHELSPGCVALVPAHTPVSWSWSTRISFSILRLDPDFLDRVARSVFGLAPHDYRLTFAERPHDTAITNIAGVLAREVMRGEPGSRLYAQSLASILAVHLLRHYAQCADGSILGSCATVPEIAPAAPLEAGSRGGAQPRAVSDALAYIHENYARELSLTDIAGAVHLSPFHVARFIGEVA